MNVTIRTMVKKIPKLMPIIAPEDKVVAWLLFEHVVQNSDWFISPIIGVVGETIWVKYASAAPEKSPDLYRI
jgi:hypothetical protein